MNIFRSNVGTLNEILFEKKNKLYGAYAIRAAYGSTVFKSLGITSAMILGGVWLLFVATRKEVVPVIPDAGDPPPIVEYTVNLEPPKKLNDPAENHHSSATAALQNNPITRVVINNTAVDSVAPVNHLDDLNNLANGNNPNGNSNNTNIGTPGTGTATTTDNTNTGSTEPFTFVEVFPSLAGGLPAFWAKNLHYPNEARERGIEGRVVINFVIDQEGNVESCKVTEGLGAGCDEEVLRVVKLMPKWKPGMMSGKPVRVSFKQAVQFKLR